MNASFIDDGLVSDIPLSHTGGVKRLYRFQNDWGASVVRNRFTYGSEDGLYELAVLKWDGNECELNYDHPESLGDVRGYLTVDQVNEILEKIKNT